MINKVGVFFIFFAVFVNSFGQERNDSIYNSIILDEVTVNATKNNLKLKETPIAVSVLSFKDLEDNNVEKMSDLSGLTPNFYMPEYGSKLTAPIYIRGIGSRINAPSVGLYVDYVPYFEKSSFQFDFFDLKKIEILRGPQGTLYGKNSMGGLINILTLSPQNYQGTKIKATAGNFGVYQINAGHYAKLTDQWAASITGNYTHNDGFYKNNFTQDFVDNLDAYGLRNRVVFTPNKLFHIENIASYENSKQGGYPYAVYDFENQTSSAIDYNRYSSYNRKLFSDALHLDYTIENWKLSNTASFQYLKDAQLIDQDFIPSDLYFIKQFQDQKTFSNEMIAQSNNTKKYKWLIGAFGFHQGFDNVVDAEIYPQKIWYEKTYDKNSTGAALFHQSTFNFNERISLTGGLRYDYESSQLHYLYKGIKNTVQLPAIDTVYNKLKDHVLLPKLALNIDLGSSAVYLSYTTGYKPGGFNTTFERPEDLLFKNEMSDNYEMGTKQTFGKNRFSLDTSFFLTYLKNQQIYQTVPSGRGSYLTNAGTSLNYGLEIAFQMRDLQGWQGNFSYGTTHAQILEYVVDAKVNYNNNTTPYVPKSMLYAEISKSISFDNDRFHFSLSTNRIGKQYWDLKNEHVQNPYYLLHSKLSFSKGKWNAGVWGKNLLNTAYNVFSFEIANLNTYAQQGKPRTFGIDLSYEF
jgi:outer membrane receptor protein involved in Fe transport